MNKLFLSLVLLGLSVELHAKAWRDLAVYRAITGEEYCGSAPHCASARNISGTKICKVKMQDLNLSENSHYDGSGWIHTLPKNSLVKFTGREIRDPSLGLMISEVRVISSMTEEKGWIFAYRMDCAYESEIRAAKIKRAPSGALVIGKMN